LAQQHGAERLAHRVVPVRQLHASQAVLDQDRVFVVALRLVELAVRPAHARLVCCSPACAALDACSVTAATMASFDAGFRSLLERPELTLLATE